MYMHMSVCGNKHTVSRLGTVTRLVRSGGLLRHLLDHGELLPLRHRRVGGAAAAAGRVRQALKPEPVKFPVITPQTDELYLPFPYSV